jgi:NADPH:quinone reductase-like Zn-dependent oxidoreductase
MKGIVQERIGSPDVLQFVDTDRPAIGPDDVLVRVHAAALNPYDGTCCAATRTSRGSCRPHIGAVLGGTGHRAGHRVRRDRAGHPDADRPRMVACDVHQHHD